MDLVIDTSGVRSALAVLSGDEAREDVRWARRDDDLGQRAKALLAGARPERVLVATGPGSFTSLRAGVSFAVGMALGLQVPLHHVGSLELQAARSPVPATAIGEAGRGRLYALSPGREAIMSALATLDPSLPLVGWVSQALQAELAARGCVILAEDRLRSFSVAARKLAEVAPRVEYDRVPVRYLSSFGTLRN